MLATDGKFNETTSQRRRAVSAPRGGRAGARASPTQSCPSSKLAAGVGSYNGAGKFVMAWGAWCPNGPKWQVARERERGNQKKCFSFSSPAWGPIQLNTI